MKHTGERHILKDSFDDEAQYYNHLMHLATYHFAKKECEGKSVLDYGCGSGYGTSILASVANKAVGSDIDPEAVSFSKNKYSAYKNLLFCEMNSFQDEKFDVITSFQVIEHVENEKKYIENIKRLLDDDGVVLISTPNRSHRLFNFQRPWNPFHIKEYTAQELENTLKKFFKEVKLIHITAEPDVVMHEIQRTRKQRLITLPSTLKLYPNSLRKKMLEMQSCFFQMIKKMIKKNKKITTPMNTSKKQKWTIETIQFVEDAKFSTDILAICRGKK